MMTRVAAAPGAALGIVSVSEASIYIHLLSSGSCHRGMGLNMRRVAGLSLAKIITEVMMTFLNKKLLCIHSVSQQDLDPLLAL